MDAKKIKKLKRLVFLIIVLLIVIVSFNSWRRSKIFEGEGIKTSSGELKTDATINVAEIDSGRFIKDYTNPTTEEIAKAYDIYGYGNCYFTDEGLYVKADEYGYYQNRLITNLWLSKNTLVSKVKKPEVGNIDNIEIGQTYLQIYLYDVTEKELKTYIKEIDDEYNDELETKKDSTLYIARNEKNDKVEIKYNSMSKIASILYSFN